jgi:hypothetical protein
VPDGRALTSQELASLIVDALVDAGFVGKPDMQSAIAVATTEIDVRKALGDYSPFPSSGSARDHRDRAG